MIGIAGDKMLAHLGRVAGDHRPITADIFLTNYCNNYCPYCTYRRWDIDSGAYSMNASEFAEYAERLLELGVQGIILTGGGEPTVCPDFEAITKWMEGRGIRYGINTNFNRLYFIRPDYLKVSLDGWDEDSYEKARGVRRYEQVRSNIVRYAEWKKEHSPKTSLGIQCVCQSLETVEKFYAANKDLPVDYIVFRPLESTGGKAYADADSKAEAVLIMDAVKKLAKEDARVVLNFKWHLLGKQESSCIGEWAQIAVNERGRVMYCCHKPYQIVGDLMDKDILQKKAEAGTDMATCDIPCRMTGPNVFIALAEMPRKDDCFI